MKNILLGLSLCMLFIARGQVLNLDRIVSRDSLQSKWLGFTTVNFSSDKIRKNFLDGSINAELSRFFKNDYFLVGVLTYDFSVNGSTILQNDGFAQLRYRDNDKHEWSNESYLQYQWNGPLGMEFRQVLGSNLRKRFFEKKRIDLYSGLGIFIEKERWNWNGVINSSDLEAKPTRNRTLFRLNHYWKMAYKLNDQLDLSAISYVQFPMNANFQNARWYMDINLFLKMSRTLNFVIHWDHTYDGFRLVPIDYFFYSLNFGIQLKW